MTELSQEEIRPEGMPSEPVDMVVYFGLERVVIGKAGINPDGTFTAQMDGDIDDRAKQILGYVQGEFSFSLPRILKPRFQPQYTAGDLPFDGDLPQ